MLVLDGRAIELEAHLRRLDASLNALFGDRLPDAARGEVVEQASAVEHGKLRITVIPAERSLIAKVATTEVARPLVFPGRDGAVALRSVVAGDGLGAHKWADRRLLEAAEAELPGAVPLLLDGDALVLEASRGSVFSMRERTLTTPPADGRILPSIARQRVIEVAAAQGVEVRERALALAELRAGEAFLAGSVRGIEPVRSVDGTELPGPGEIGARIASGLKRRWLAVPRAGSAAAVEVGRRAGRRAR